MPLEITEGYDIRARLAEAEAEGGKVYWTGKGAERLGLTGEADPQDVERLFSTPPDEPEAPEEKESVLDWLRANKVL